MTKFWDAMITIGFTLLFGFYILQVLAFGGFSGEPPFVYVLCSFIGLILIWVSFMNKFYPDPKKLLAARAISVLLLFSVVYFDFKHSSRFAESAIIMGSIVLIYTTTTIMRAGRIVKENNNELPADN